MKLENVVQSACMYTMSHHCVEPGDEVALGGWVKNSLLGHPRKHPYHPHGGNRKLTLYPFLDVLIHLLLSETIFSPLLKFPPWLSMDLFGNDPL